MTKEQYAKMLREICEIHKTGGDTRACIAKYTERYQYVYVYNDDIFKVLLGNPANEAVTVDFLNAVLKLDGADCIDHVTFANPVSPEAFAKTSTSDIVADDQHKDRIVLEVQHVNGKSYADRLVLYAAKHVVASPQHPSQKSGKRGVLRKADHHACRNSQVPKREFYQGQQSPCAVASLF